jgi:hypothetical protein
VAEVGLLPLSLLLGPVWRLLNRFRSLYFLIGRLLRVDMDGGNLSFTGTLAAFGDTLPLPRASLRCDGAAS